MLAYSKSKTEKNKRKNEFLSFLFLIFLSKQIQLTFTFSSIVIACLRNQSFIVNMTFYHRRRQTPSPNILLVTLPDHYDRRSRVIHREQKPQIPRIIGCHVNHLDLHDSSTWQRSSDKIGQMSAAPDVAYRLTYLETPGRAKSAKTRSSSRSRLTQSFSYFPSEEKPPQRMYDYILQSIRQNEQQRNLQEPSLSCLRVQRPQNEDSTLRRVLKERKSSATTTYSRISSATHSHLKSPQSFVNYINHSRGFQTPSSSIIFQN